MTGVCKLSLITIIKGFAETEISFDLCAQLYEIPFYIVMDHEKKAVVVSVRGTLSFEVWRSCLIST